MSRSFCQIVAEPGSGARRRVLAAGGAVLLAGFGISGCSFAPDHVRPAQPVPATFPEQAGAADSSASLARTGWREFFQEPELQRLIAEALANNRDIRIAAGRVAEARAAFRIQGSALYPQLDAVATGTRGRTPADLSITGSAQTGTQLTSVLSAGWEIDFWGRLRNLRASAREQYLATEEARRAVAISLVAQVAGGYLLEREYEERTALAVRTTATREEALRILRRRYQVGSGSKLEMTQAQVLLAQAQTALQGLEQDRAINRNALALLVGHPVEIAGGSLSLAEVGGGRALPPGLPSHLLENRPDIVAAEHRLRAANADIGAARAAFFPNVSLTGTFGTASAELDGLFADGSGSWSFTPTISLPIFNAGRNAAGLDLAKARRNTAVADYELTVQRAFRDVADALVRRRQLAAQIATTQDMLAALVERARLANLRFENGRSAYLEVLDAQRDLFGTEQALVQLRRAHFSSGVALYAALGGGFPHETGSAPADPAAGPATTSASGDTKR
ncbi:MAG: efflux transporter outer membrane subunit [Sphingomonadales bacterium]|nr:efflux transporter outer membrane subunit [Sphingomonadales bacterium]MBU3993796.1 efflux transporter outer membrane subunit [Alphaproteobacteria bacterium]